MYAAELDELVAAREPPGRFEVARERAANDHHDHPAEHDHEGHALPELAAPERHAADHRDVSLSPQRRHDQTDRPYNQPNDRLLHLLRSPFGFPVTGSGVMCTTSVAMMSSLQDNQT